MSLNDEIVLYRRCKEKWISSTGKISVELGEEYDVWKKKDHVWLWMIKKKTTKQKKKIKTELN